MHLVKCLSILNSSFLVQSWAVITIYVKYRNFLRVRCFSHTSQKQDAHRIATLTKTKQFLKRNGSIEIIIIFMHVNKTTFIKGTQPFFFQIFKRFNFIKMILKWLSLTTLLGNSLLVLDNLHLLSKQPQCFMVWIPQHVRNISLRFSC